MLKVQNYPVQWSVIFLKSLFYKQKGVDELSLGSLECHYLVVCMKLIQEFNFTREVGGGGNLRKRDFIPQIWCTSEELMLFTKLGEASI